jgi:dTDP-4-dehydrorhamnose reductase
MRLELLLIKQRPDIIINPAAYTAVDKAESEPEIAYQINTLAPEVLASMAAELRYSVDTFFDGLCV